MRCAYCGEPLDAGAQRIAFDGCVLPVHADCAQEMSERAEAIAARPARGSVARGAVGALAGALIGAIPWAVVFVLGYVTSLIGLLIGFLSNLLYGKFGGKNCRLRIAVVVLAVLIGVAAGQVGGYTIDFTRSYGSTGGYEITGLTRSQFVQTQWDWILLTDSAEVLGRQYDRQLENIPEDARDSLVSREEYIDRTLSDEFISTLSDARAEFWTNAAMGAFFGLLGCGSVFAQLFKQTRKAHRAHTEVREMDETRRPCAASFRFVCRNALLRRICTCYNEKKRLRGRRRLAPLEERPCSIGSSPLQCSQPPVRDSPVSVCACAAGPPASPSS